MDSVFVAKELCMQLIQKNPLRLSNMNICKIDINNKSYLCFHWNCTVPESMKSQKCDTKAFLTSDGESHC